MRQWRWARSWWFKDHLLRCSRGGHLRFPEDGAYLYRPGAGAAVAFSGSHLHEALPVTRGKRHMLLSFLFGEGDRRSGSFPVV